MMLRERFFAAMRRSGEGYVPFSFSLCPSLEKEFGRRTGRTDYAEYYGFPMRMLSAGAPGLSAKRFAPWFQGMEDVMVNPVFGFGERSVGFEHFTQQVFPLRAAEGVEELLRFPLPEVGDFDWNAVEERAREIREKGFVAAASMEITLFESAWYLRGMEEFLEDMVVRPEWCEALLERLCVLREGMAKAYAQAGVDVLSLGDDVGTQQGMMFSPALWRSMLKPRLERVIQAAKRAKPDILITYHSDGNVTRIVPELIEIGIDALNPVQPECMDAEALKREFGDRLSFYGCIGTQSTMPFGSAEDVRETCRRLIRTVGAGGGLYLAPTHMLEPEVPWENVEAFLTAVAEHNAKG